MRRIVKDEVITIQEINRELYEEKVSKLLNAGYEIVNSFINTGKGAEVWYAIMKGTYQEYIKDEWFELWIKFASREEFEKKEEEVKEIIDDNQGGNGNVSIYCIKENTVCKYSNIAVTKKLFEKFKGLYGVENVRVKTHEDEEYNRAMEMNPNTGSKKALVR